MGHSTEYRGKLTFKNDPSARQLGHLRKLLESMESRIVITDDFDGLEWDGEEKANFDQQHINEIILKMQMTYPAFGLVGTLDARAEQFEDNFKIIMEDNVAKVQAIQLVGNIVECPHCAEKFEI